MRCGVHIVLVAVIEQLGGLVVIQVYLLFFRRGGPWWLLGVTAMAAGFCFQRRELVLVLTVATSNQLGGFFMVQLRGVFMVQLRGVFMVQTLCLTPLQHYTKDHLVLGLVFLLPF